MNVYGVSGEIGETVAAPLTARMIQLTFAFTLDLRLCAEIQTVCSGLFGAKERMLLFRPSSSRFVSTYSLAKTRIAGFGQGGRTRERVIAARADPLGFRFGSISNSAVSHSLRKNEMPLPHSVYQPDPTCVSISQKFSFLSPPFPTPD